MSLQLDDLAALDAPSSAAIGVPLTLPVAQIDEDPEQPRREFEGHGLQDLAETIRSRGVRQPISVRPNLRVAGRWILNFGARRLRACKLAGVTDIPAFIDTTADSYDQVIENEQREGLKPLELALFVQKRLALGDSQADIAARLGKSRQWVTLTTALIEPPEWLLQAYREGRCRGLNELYELRRLHGEHGDVVEAWAAQRLSITRDRIAALRAELEDEGEGARVIESSLVLVSEDGRMPSQAASADKDAAHAGGQAPIASERVERPMCPLASRSKRRVHVEFEGQDYQLVVSVAPEQPDCMYVRPLAGGPRRLAPVAKLRLLGFVRG